MNLYKKKIKYTHYQINRADETQWIFDKINLYLTKYKKIKILKSVDAIHMHSYSEGDEFMRHRDIYYEGQVLNVGVCLNDDYDGGDFVLYEPYEPLPKKQGSIYSFKNTREHEVLKITKGIRWSLIAFLFDEHIQISKNLL